MAIRTTVDIPEPLYERLRQQAEATGTSMRALIIEAVEDAFPGGKKGRRVTGPLISGGKRGPLYPTDENPYDLIFP